MPAANAETMSLHLIPAPEQHESDDGRRFFQGLICDSL